MSQSAGLFAYGSKFEVSDDNVTFTALAEVAMVDGLKEKVNKAKATHLLSDSAAKESKPGISETDDVKVTLNFTKGQMTTLKGYRRTPKYWRISAPLDTGETTPSRWSWHGYWVELGPEKFDPEDNQVIQATLTVCVDTGIVTYLAGS